MVYSIIQCLWCSRMLQKKAIANETGIRWAQLICLRVNYSIAPTATVGPTQGHRLASIRAIWPSLCQESAACTQWQPTRPSDINHYCQTHQRWHPMRWDLRAAKTTHSRTIKTGYRSIQTKATSKWIIMSDFWRRLEIKGAKMWWGTIQPMYYKNWLNLKLANWKTPISSWIKTISMQTLKFSAATTR